MQQNIILSLTTFWLLSIFCTADKLSTTPALPTFNMLSRTRYDEPIIHTPIYPSDDNFQPRSRSISEPNVTYNINKYGSLPRRAGSVKNNHTVQRPEIVATTPTSPTPPTEPLQVTNLLVIYR